MIIYATGVFFGAATEGFYIAIGYLSHLLSDSFTVLGVGYLHPIVPLKARGFIEVGTVQESLFLIGVVVCGAAIILL